MGDNAIEAIDSVFDRIDGFVEGAARIVNRSKHTEDKLGEIKSRRDGVSAQAGTPAPSSSTALARREVARIIESVDAETGSELFVVTYGAARAECTTREMAEKLRAALEMSP